MENTADDEEREELIVYELEKGKVYNKFQMVSENKKSPAMSRSTKVRILVTVCILLTEMGERLTYYSLVANTILFGKTVLGYPETDATTINQVYAGFAFILPIGGGFIADSFTGRFKTIVTAGLIYILGIGFVLLSAIDFGAAGMEAIDQSGKRGLFITGLALVATGTGGIKANVGPFGAEQLESLGKEAVQSFFNWFYWVINVGAFIAYAGVSYIQQEISFAWGYFVPLITMTLSLFIFVVIKKKYICTEPKGSMMSTAFAICGEGCACCKKPPEPNPSLPEGSEKKMLARAKVSFGGSHKDHLVDGVGSVIKVIPICILTIVYWIGSSQMGNTYYVQGTRMDVRLTDDVNVPVAALNIFNTVTLILLIPIADRVLYPFFTRIGLPLTYLKRMGIGMILAALSLFVAGIVEVERKHLMNHPGGSHVQVLADKNYTASSLSIFVQIPQFALIGASEIFTSITTLEFAYNQAPVSMQGLLTGIFLASTGFGSLLSSALLVIVEKTTESDPWWGDEINDVKMENLLFMFGGLMMANFVLFCVVAHFYSYQDPSTFENEKDEDETGLGGKKSDEAKVGEKTKINKSHNRKAYTDNDAFSAL